MLRIETSGLNSNKNFKVVDQYGSTLVAFKKEVLSTIKRMVAGYNDQETLIRARALLRNRLIDILKQLQGSSLVAISVREGLKDPLRSKDDIIQTLKEQAKDNPVVMTSILGGEAVQILQIL